MRANIEEYKAVEEAAMKFVKSVAEGNSSYAKELFIDEAVLFGFLDGKLEPPDGGSRRADAPYCNSHRKRDSRLDKEQCPTENYRRPCPRT